MPAMERSGDMRSVLFTRDDLPTPARKRRDAVVQQLRRLEARGDIGALDVVDWAKRVPVAVSSAQCDRHEAFSAWADAAGVRLTPFFDTRVCYCTETGRKREELVLPALCLAVYEDGELSTVAPHADGGRSVSVEDIIDGLDATDAADDIEAAEDAGAATVPTQ